MAGIERCPRSGLTASCGLAEPEYDLRLLPGTGPGVELLPSVMRHYARLADYDLDIERVLAWHVLNTLSDALWR